MMPTARRSTGCSTWRETERAFVLADNQRRRVDATTPDALTTREREIAALMAGGLSNRGIAERLVIAEGTVEVHAKHILSKLGFRSRTQLAVWSAHRQSNDHGNGNN